MEFPSSGMDLDSRRDSGNSGFGDGATGGGSGNPLASPGPSSGGMGGPGGGNAGTGGGLIGGKKRRSESDVEGGRSGGAADNTMQLSLESIRGFTEILGMPASSGILPEDAGKELSEEVTFR